MLLDARFAGGASRELAGLASWVRPLVRAELGDESGFGALLAEVERHCAAAPEHQFTIADFSWLPPQPNGVINAPVVQMQKAGATIDLHGEYLRATGEVDILFPTNFDHLAHMIHAASAMSNGGSSGDGGGEAKAIQNVTTAEFMREWHDLEATRTQDGFNPLVDDFTNTRFVVTG